MRVQYAEDDAALSSELSEPFLGIELDPNSKMPLRRQLHTALTEAINFGRFPAGTRLPSTRSFAKQLGISRATVVDVFEQLLSDGLTTGRVGCGTFVNRSKAGDSKKQRKSGGFPFKPSQKVIRTVCAAADAPPTSVGVGAFRVGVPALNLFPMDLWTRSIVRAGRATLRDVLDYGDCNGYLPLRRILADRLALLRGVRCDVDQLFIVEGAHRAIAHAAQILVEVGDTVCVEDPCSARLRGVLVACGATIAPSRVDASGMAIPSMNAVSDRPKMICVTPSHQFPTGVTMTLERRQDLLAWARRSNSWIVEDDHEYEFHHEGRAVDTLHALDDEGRVIYVGSFSSTMFPGLKMGYVVVPESLVAAYSATLRVGSCGPNSLEQAALTHFIDIGEYSRHLNRMRALYAERRQALVTSVEREMADLVRLGPTGVGTFAVATILTGSSDRSISALAAQRGLDVRPISLLAAKGSANGLVLGYAAASFAQIKAGCTDLSQCLRRAPNPVFVGR